VVPSQTADLKAQAQSIKLPGNTTSQSHPLCTHKQQRLGEEARMRIAIRQSISPRSRGLVQGHGISSPACGESVRQPANRKDFYGFLSSVASLRASVTAIAVSAPHRRGRGSTPTRNRNRTSGHMRARGRRRPTGRGGTHAGESRPEFGMDLFFHGGLERTGAAHRISPSSRAGSDSAHERCCCRRHSVCFQPSPLSRRRPCHAAPRRRRRRPGSPR
jgi:hypothetical protein